jgi:hypothetical protein
MTAAQQAMTTICCQRLSRAALSQRWRGRARPLAINYSLFDTATGWIDHHYQYT